MRRRTIAAIAAAGIGITGIAAIGSAETPTVEPTPTPTASIAEATAVVERIIDGDTLVTSVGTVRLIGIDTPEQGVCGFDTATDTLATLLPIGETVELVSHDEDTDKYDRLLRYIKVDGGSDVGLQMIVSGEADARYDSRDGYGAHPMESEYIAADTVPNSACEVAAPEPEETVAPAPAPEPTEEAPAPAPPTEAPEPAPAAEPWNSPGPDLDCDDIGHPVTITGPDYHRLDADGDGVGCQSY